MFRRLRSILSGKNPPETAGPAPAAGSRPLPAAPESEAAESPSPPPATADALDAWLAESRRLAAILEDAAGLTAAAPATLALARHRSQLTHFDWTTDIPSRDAPTILALTEDLPATERLHLRVLLAAILIQRGRAEDGRNVVGSLRGMKQWFCTKPADISLPWAVVLADCPQLLPTWLGKTGGEGHGAVDPLARHAPDASLAEIAKLLEQSRARSYLNNLLQQMSYRNRLTALLECSSMGFTDLPGENWTRWDNAEAMRRDLQDRVCRQLLAAGREDEAVQRYQEHFPNWRGMLAHAARTLKRLPLLRSILATVPDETCSPWDWLCAVTCLVEETKLGEGWPFLQRLRPADWQDDHIAAEELLDRAIVTGELELAGRLLELLPAKKSKPLQTRLAKAMGKQLAKENPCTAFLEHAQAALASGNFGEVVAQSRQGLTAAKQIRNREQKRDANFRFAACLVAAGTEREGFAVLHKYGERAADHDAVRELTCEFIDACAGLGALPSLIRGCVTEGEQDRMRRP